MAQDATSLELAHLVEVLDLAADTHHPTTIAASLLAQEGSEAWTLRRPVSVLVPLLWETHLPGGQRCHGTNPDGQKDRSATEHDTAKSLLIGWHYPTRCRDWPPQCL